jgi:hypothetical protein
MKSKYLNKKTVVDNIKFASQKEASYYQDLKLLYRAGEVIKFELQPEFILQDKFRKNGKAIRAIKYIADFKVTYKDGHTEIVDTKGFKKESFLLKAKMFEYKYPDLEIKII